MKGFLRRIRIPALCALLALIVLLCAFAAYPALTARGGTEQAYRGILRVWQIDTFEGGTGSRAAFLNSVARSFEAEHEGIKLLVTPHTPLSAANAAAEGEYPDVLSFGTGTDFAADAAVPLQGECDSGSLGGEVYALPWCRGQYFLFTLEGDFSDITDKNTLIAQGRGTLPQAAAWKEGLCGAFPVQDSVAAYTAFLQGKYKYLLGTQRDVYRFRARDLTVQAKPLTSFSDIWQYAAVCTRDGERYAAASAFVQYLRSEEVQKLLPRIGMLPVCGDSVYSADDAAMHAAQQNTPPLSVNAFLTEQTLTQLRTFAAAALNGDEIGAKNLEKFFTETL